ncbi:MAG: hypothetical protein R3F43_15855 [bacterium]
MGATGPGVVYDALGLDGARAALLKRMDPDHWHDPDPLAAPGLAGALRSTSRARRRT